MIKLAEQQVKMPTGYRPIGDRVLVEPVTEEMEGLIHIPHEAGQIGRADGRIAQVKAIGRDFSRDDIESGDYIMFDITAGRQYTLDGRDVFLLEEKEVIAKVEK